MNLRGLTAPLRLGPSHRKLEIDFAALSFTSPGECPIPLSPERL